VTLLQVRNLSAFYGDFQALFGVSLDAAEGETVAVIGANGAGKTTFLRALAGALPVPRDTVEFAGQPVGGSPAHALVELGIVLVPEGRKIFPSLSVRENLEIGAYRRRAGPWTVERVYGLFPVLSERRDQPGTNLSGGEQQMLALGRALLTNPRVLLLDEATEGLAPLLAREIWRVISTLRDGGVASVVVDRNVGAVLDHADRCTVLVKGEVVVDLSSDELRTRPELLHRHLGV
jgi:branched-chain amino acid transport system ATP-binding protein